MHEDDRVKLIVRHLLYKFYLYGITSYTHSNQHELTCITDIEFSCQLRVISRFQKTITDFSKHPLAWVQGFLLSLKIT